MRKFNLRLDDKGFTLVELIVTLAIAAIVMTVAGNYLFFGNRMFTENEVKNTDKYIGDTIYDFIKERLTYAGKIEVLEREKVLSGDASPKYSHVFALSGNSMENKDGYLYFTNDKEKLLWNAEKAGIYGTGFYRNNKITYTFQIDKKDASNRSFILTIYVYNKDGEEVYKTGASIKNLNIGLENKAGQIETQYTGDDIYKMFKNPVISYEEKDNKLIDPLEEKAKEVRGYYVGTYNELVKIFLEHGSLNNNTIKYADECKDWFDFEKAAYLNNDAIRDYVCQKYYGGSWPIFDGFPEEMLSDLNEKEKTAISQYLKTTKLYYQPMIGGNLSKDKEFSDENCFIYLSTNSEALGSKGQWRAYFVFDHENNIWYANDAIVETKNWQNLSITTKNWQNLKSDLKNKDKWIPLNPYP